MGLCVVGRGGSPCMCVCALPSTCPPCTHSPPSHTHFLPPAQVSIVPRGSAALGFAQYLPNENLLMTSLQMGDMMSMALGGRAAEQVG